MLLDLPRPYLLFLGDTVEPTYAKTAFGLRDWAGDACVGEFALPQAAVSTGLPRMSPAEAAAAGARSLVIGVVNSGGFIPESWVLTLVEALEAGLHIVSGMHRRLADIPVLADTAERVSKRLIDVRVPPRDLTVGTGRPRSGRRLLAVGTDCALGKKYTALALARAFAVRGIDVDFRATGQTGIMISGGGIPIDSIVTDFVSGAAELLSPDAAPDHWDVIEGQGSLLHPSFAAVTLGLLHGSQPDVMVLCHDPRRAEIRGLETSFPIPGLVAAMDLHLPFARMVNPAARFVGISLNTGGMSADEAEAAIHAAEAEAALPVADPLRAGPAFERLVDACLG